MLLVILLILNALNYFALYALMPDVTIGEFFMICYVISIIFNVGIYIYLLKNNQASDRLILIQPALTTVFYSLSAYFIQARGKFESFIQTQSINTGTVNISVVDNMFSVSQIVTIFILNAGILYLTKRFWSLRSNDKSRQFV